MPVFLLDLPQCCIKFLPIASFALRSCPQVQEDLGVRDTWHGSNLRRVLKRNHTIVWHISSKLAKNSSHVSTVRFW